MENRDMKIVLEHVWESVKGQTEPAKIGQEQKRFSQWTTECREEGWFKQEDRAPPSREMLKLMLKTSEDRVEVRQKDLDKIGSIHVVEKNKRRKNLEKAQNSLANNRFYIPKFLYMVTGQVAKLEKGGEIKIIGKTEVSPVTPPPYEASPYQEARSALLEIENNFKSPTHMNAQAPVVQVSGVVDLTDIADKESNPSGAIKGWLQEMHHVAQSDVPEGATGGPQATSTPRQGGTLPAELTSELERKWGGHSRTPPCNSSRNPSWEKSDSHCLEQVGRGTQNRRTTSPLRPTCHDLKGTIYQMPLVSSSGTGHSVYTAHSLQDVSLMAATLPPLEEGGAAWIRKFIDVTTGNAVCLGDLRKVITHQAGGSVLDDIEKEAGTIAIPDVELLAVHCADLWDVIRELFPPNVLMANLTQMPLKAGEDGNTYLRRVRNTWADTTGSDPVRSIQTLALFYNAVKASLPLEIQVQLQNIVGLDTMSFETWKAQVTHHINTYNKKEKDKKDEVSELQCRLLKAQLRELNNKTNNSKNQLPVIDPQLVAVVPDECQRSMVQMVSQMPQLGPHPLPSYERPNYESQMSMEALRERPPPQQYRNSRGGRGYYNRGPWGFNQQSMRGNCFNCGGTGHWARVCPQAGAPHPQGGYTRGRGGYQASNYRSQQTSPRGNQCSAPHSSMMPQ